MDVFEVSFDYHLMLSTPETQIAHINNRLMQCLVSDTFRVSCNYLMTCLKPSMYKDKLDRMVDRVKPWFMVHGLAHGS